MNLSELKSKVDRAVEFAIECGENPESVSVSIMIEDNASEPVWSSENVEMHYDNNLQTSGCVFTADLCEIY